MIIPSNKDKPTATTIDQHCNPSRTQLVALCWAAVGQVKTHSLSVFQDVAKVAS